MKKSRLTREQMLAQTAARLSKLSGGLTDGGIVPEADSLDLSLVIWRLVDAATTGQVTETDTNDMGLIGNTVSFAAHEVDHSEAADAARAWNGVVSQMRKRFDRLGSYGVTGEEYLSIRNAADGIDRFINSQPRGVMARAYRQAMSLACVSRYGSEVTAP